MFDIIDVIIGGFLIYLGYKFVLPFVLQYGWIILGLFIFTSAVSGFAVSFSNYIVSLMENMSK